MHIQDAPFPADNNSRATRIVLIDDHPRLFCAVLEVLENAAMVVASPRLGSDILDFLDEQQPDLLILTLGRSSSHRLAACETIRRSERWKDLAILFLSADPRPKLRLSAFAAGADDYLVQPIVLDELVTRIHQRIERTSARAKRLSTDALTGLLLRRSMLERVASNIGQARRQHQQLGLGIIDLDGLKQINDTHGHLVGDRVLAALGNILCARFRIEDLRCRWGGDEFVVVCPGKPASVVAAILFDIRQSFEAIVFSGESGRTFHTRFSVGVASYPDDGEDFETLLGRADRALYAAKTARVDPRAQFKDA